MSSPVGCKSTRVRFTYNDDLAFLKEFMAHNPLQNINGWEEIQRNLELITRKKFSIRTLKHHLQLLIEIWLKKDEGDKIRSGVEEILSEKDTLLQEISSLCSEYNFTTKRKRPVSKEHQLSELGKKARDKFASIFVEKPDEIDNNEIPAELATPVYELQDHNYVNSDEIPISIIEDVEVVNEVGEITDINTKSTSGTAPTSKNKKELKISSNPNISKSGSNILGPARKKWNKREPIRNNALSYLSEKHERENELKKKGTGSRRQKTQY